MEPLKPAIHPFYLPQLSAPYKFIVSQLEEMGFQHEPILVAASQLKPIQKEVDLNKTKSMTEVEDAEFDPIWISRKGNIYDGHHRVASKKLKEGDNAKIRAIRLDADDRDGCAILKIVQDRWEQKQKGLYK